MSQTLINRSVTIKAKYFELTGSLSTSTYADGSTALQLWTDEGPEVLSTNLTVYGMHPDQGNVFIKDYSEHEGVAQALVKLGLAEIVREVPIGGYGARGYEVKILAPAVEPAHV